MRWFRLYSDVVHDPKVQRLHPATFKHWINILCLVSENSERGYVPDVESVSYSLRVKPCEAERILDKLVEVGLLETSTDGKLFPHNWTNRQRITDDVSTRVARHRKNKSKDIEVLQEDVTLLKRTVDTDTDTDTDTEKRDKEAEKTYPPSLLFNLWNDIIKEPRATVMNKTREAKCRLRLKEMVPDEWRLVLERIKASSFLKGENDRGWRADFDWLISNDTNAVKILEGKYDNKSKGGLSNDFEKRFLSGDTKTDGSLTAIAGFV